MVLIECANPKEEAINAKIAAKHIRDAIKTFIV